MRDEITEVAQEMWEILREYSCSKEMHPVVCAAAVGEMLANVLDNLGSVNVTECVVELLTQVLEDQKNGD